MLEFGSNIGLLFNTWSSDDIPIIEEICSCLLLVVSWRFETLKYVNSRWPENDFTLMPGKSNTNAYLLTKSTYLSTMPDFLLRWFEITPPHSYSTVFQSRGGRFWINEDTQFKDLAELIHHHSLNSSGLVTTLTHPVPNVSFNLIFLLFILCTVNLDTFLLAHRFIIVFKKSLDCLHEIKYKSPFFYHTITVVFAILDVVK